MSAEERRPSLEELTREIEAALREAGYQGAFVRDAEKGLLGIEGGGALSIAHIYEQLAGHARERRREALAKAARMLVAPQKLPETWAEAALKIRLAAKTQLMLVAEELRRQMGQGPAHIFVAMLTPHLALELVVPCEGGNLSVPCATLDGWGVTAPEALRIAGHNDAADVRRPWFIDAAHPGVYRSPWKDGRDAGRLYLPRVFDALPLRGKPVVMLPTPSMMLVAGSEDEQGLVHLAQLTKKSVDDTGLVYVLRAVRMADDGQAWEDWLPPRGHRAYEALRLLQAMQERRDYAEHAALVAELARVKGVESAVLPRLEVVQESLSGAVMTVTTWRAGKPVALPKADAIVLRQGAKTLGLVLWDELKQELPGQLKPLPGYPPRHLATDFPEEWQLGGLDIKPWSGPKDPGPGIR